MTVDLFSHTGRGSPWDLLAETSKELIELEADTDDSVILNPKVLNMFRTTARAACKPRK